MSGLTGIGCTLVPHPPSGALRVSSLDPEGPAARSGYIGIGDVLFEVDENRYHIAGYDLAIFLQ